MELAGYLSMYGGLVAGILLLEAERRLKIKHGVLLLVYIIGMIVGCLITIFRS